MESQFTDQSSLDESQYQQTVRSAICGRLNIARSGMARPIAMQHYAAAAFPPISVLTNTETTEREHLETLARRLYILAWVIEGVAVALGLGMALSLNLPGESTIGSFLLGGGGFVMVACAELSKIPLATFFVETPGWRAKAATLAFLLLMSFITFETIFMSLERGFYARLQLVHTHNEELASLKTNHGKVSAAIDNPSADFLSTRTALEKQLAEIDKGARSELEAIREERENLRKQQQQSRIPQEIEQQLATVETKRRLLTEDRDRKVAEAEDRARRTREFWLREKNAARQAGNAERELEATNKLNAANSRTERTRIEGEYQRKLGDVETESKNLVDRRAELVVESEAAIAPRLNELSQAEQRVSSEYGRKRDDLRSQLGEVHRREKENLAGVGDQTKQREELAAQIKAKEAAFRRIAADSQLHRIAVPFAGWWKGEHFEPHTIPETYVKTIAVIWFGSMAMLGALGGAVVAMVSQLLRKRASKVGMPGDAASSAEAAAAKQQFWVSLRRMLLKWKFARVKTKTVEVVRVETQTVHKVIAVPVPVNDSYDKLKPEYAALSASLSPEPSKT